MGEKDLQQLYLVKKYEELNIVSDNPLFVASIREITTKMNELTLLLGEAPEMT